MEPIEPANSDDPEEQISQQIKLDSLRIRQVLLVRRAAMRFRSYFLIGAIGTAVAAIDLGWRAVRRLILIGDGLRPILYFAIAAVLGFFSLLMFAKARMWGRQASRHTLPEPVAAPDFTPLSDGSQIAKNLEEIQ